MECGVGKGRTFQMLALLNDMEGFKKSLFGFDSFEGFPEPTEEDKSERNPQKGEWNHSTARQVYEGLDKLKLKNSSNRIWIYEGFFETSLNKFNTPISLLHLDVDLYQSYKTCLEKLYPLVSNKGGVIMFDEYANENEVKAFPGAKKAIDEYLGERAKEIKRDEIFGKYYLIK